MVLKGRHWLTSSVLASGLILALACGAKRPLNQAAPVPPPALPPVQAASRPSPPASPPPAPRPSVSPSAPTEAEVFSRMSPAELNAKAPLSDAFFLYDQADLKGKEEQFCARHEEDCWPANRRAHSTIAAK